MLTPATLPSRGSRRRPRVSGSLRWPAERRRGHRMVAFEFHHPAEQSGLLNLGAVDAVAGELRRGGLAVLPTETGYLLAALATSVDAVRHAFAVKGRDPANPMHVACSSLDMAGAYAELSTRDRRL